MDILKVLTRSTNLNKKRVVARADHKGEFPSGGAPSHPQALAEISATDTKEVSRGKKRKRGGATVGEDVTGLPDFFGSGKAAAREEDDEAQPNADVDVVPVLEKPVSQLAALSLDERKQVLRQHKLKVHVVKGGIVKKPKDGKAKKRKKETGKQDKASFEDIYPRPLQSFQELHHTKLSKRLLRNLDNQGYKVPTEVQMAALPILLGHETGLRDEEAQSDAHIDLMTAAPTGSGKTLAFLIPVMNDLLAERKADDETNAQGGNSNRHVRAIVLAPTHELVDQIVNEARKLAEGTGLRAAAMQKGMHLHQGLKQDDPEGIVKSDIVVSTPQLIANSLQAEDSDALGADVPEAEGATSLPKITHLVLDEADVLLDPMFQEQTKKVWDHCTATDLRVSLWSATMGASIEAFATEYIEERRARAKKAARKMGQTPNPHHLVRVIVGLKDSAIPNVRHHLTYAASEQGKLLAMRQLLHPSTASSSSDPLIRPPFLVFTQTIPRAVALHSELRYDVPVEAGGSSRIAVLHSDLSLSSRSDIMARFRKGEIWVLITTDLLSRGVDFRGVNGVVNYDIPNSGAGYVHRAGRTGRAGREGGICVTLYTKEDIPYVKSVANVIAAAEKVKGKKPGEEGSAMPQWLLDALPDLSKQMKKDLKRKGVEARRSAKGGKVDGKGKMRISTKSGYDRKIENRRKAAKRNEKVAEKANGTQDANDGADDEFGGFDD